MITILHDHADGTVIEGSRPGDGVWEIARARGWRFSRHVGIYVRGSRDRDANRPLIDSTAAALREAGHQVTVEIDNMWRPTEVREAARAERADERVDRYSERAASAAGRAAAAHARVDAISRRFEFGQPILRGHYSEAGARRDQQRMEQGMRKAIDETANASRAADGAAGAVRNQEHRQDSRTVMRRIGRLETELRDWQRRGNQREAARVSEEIGYWRGLLDQRAASGEFVPWGPEDFAKGDEVRVLGSWLPVRRVNRKSVSVPGAYGMAMTGNDATWSETVPWDKVHGRRRDGWQLDTPNGESWPVELAKQVARWRDLLGAAERSQREYTNEAMWLRINVPLAQRNVHGLPRDADDRQLKAAQDEVRQRGVEAVRELAAAYLVEYNRLAA